MLPLILITLLCCVICFPLLITPKGRLIAAFFRMKLVMKQFTKRKKGKLIRCVNLPVRVTNKDNDFDHVLITTFGIFAIKLMAKNGKVSGSKTDQKWILTDRKGKTTEFVNPLLANDLRIKKICELLGINHDITSMVVFVKGNVKQADALSIRKFYKAVNALKKNKVFTKEEVDKYSDIILKYKDQQYADYVVLNKCPKCGQAIKATKKKNTYILSCTNPECKYKVKIR